MQAARCMDCGIPYCHTGCPVNNQIPDWNDLVYRDQWKTAALNLHSTNNFPEVTGRVCPAPCEASCTLNIDDKPVTIKTIECAIADKAFAEGWVAPEAAGEQDRQEGRGRRLGAGRLGRRPAAGARRPRGARLREAAPGPAGCCAYGIPDFKMEKHIVDRRVKQMEAEGVVFHCNVHVGKTSRPRSWRPSTTRCCWPAAPSSRSISSPSRRGATSTASYFAMTFLPQQNRRVAGEPQRESRRSRPRASTSSSSAAATRAATASARRSGRAPSR